MRPTIKAIETEAFGYKFRSRTEARWAVFFTKMPIEWHYEIEGYQLSTGQRYLPDFYLPQFDCFVEIKGDTSQLEDDMERYLRFTMEINKNLIIIVGTPDKEDMYLVEPATAITFLPGAESHCDEFCYDECIDYLYDYERVQFGFIPMQLGFHIVYKRYPPMDEMSLKCAYSEAKAARFEFGQTPTVKGLLR